MPSYLRRERRRQYRKVVGVLILVVGAALVVTWPGVIGKIAPQAVLTGLRPLIGQGGGEEPAPDKLGDQGKQDERDMALRPSFPAAVVSTRPAVAAASRPSDAGTKLPTLPLSSQPAEPTMGSRRLLAKVVSPVTQPAVDLPDGPLGAARLLQEGLELRKQDKLIEAREKLNIALHAGLTVAEVATAREALSDLANRTIFNRAVLKSDPLTRWYQVTSGDALGRIAKKADVSQVLLAKINGLANPNMLREGARIKLVQGPFHAAISKRDHDMHLYLQNVYVGTLRVALGENGSTPTGRWQVANQLENPPWTDPRSGRRYHPDDPTNPLGEFWIGLEGIEGEAVGQAGYGIHGTIEPETIGQNVSMGCVRLAPEDIELVYRLLEPGLSYVVIYE